MKNKLIIVFMLLITILAAFAVTARLAPKEADDIDYDELKVHISAFSWSASEEIFEFNQGDFRLKVNNSAGPDTIEYFIVDVTPLIPINKSGSCTITGSIINCSKQIYVGEDSSVTFTLYSPEVLGNTTHTIEITTFDDKGNFSNSTLSINVINDTIKPSYDLINPYSNHAILQSGNYNFTINYLDNESGVDSIYLFHEHISPYNGSSDVLNESDNLASNYYIGSHTNQMSVGSDTHDYFRYYYTLTDRAGNSNDDFVNWIYLDNEKPIINLASPANDAFLDKVNEDFVFTIDDDSSNLHSNFNATFDCSLLINGVSKESKVFLNSTNYVLTTNLSSYEDGYYNWSVACTDKAGNYNFSSERTFKLDTEGPEIELISHTNNSIVNASDLLRFKIIDYNNMSMIDEVNGSNYDSFGYVYYNISTNTLKYGTNLITIVANDSRGNINSKTYNITMDNKGPIINLTSPTNNSFVKDTENIIFNVEDVDKLSNIISVNENTYDNLTVTYTNNSLVYGINIITVTATDAVGNTNSIWVNMTMDNKEPDVVLISPADNEYVTQASNLLYYNVTEDYLVNCSLFIDGVYNQTNDSITQVNNFFNVTLTSSNDPYNWEIVCTDEAGNSQSQNRNVYFDEEDPIITVTSESKTSSSITVKWTTNETTTNTIDLDGSWSDSGTSMTYTKSGLDDETTYTYIITSCDLANNCVTKSGSIKTDKKPVSTGGSGGAFNYDCEEDWDCSDWSGCTDGKQTRTCTDLNDCLTEDDKPELEQTCAINTNGEINLDVDEVEDTPLAEEGKDYEEVGVDNRLTGAVVGGGSSKGWIWAVSIIGLIGAAALGLNMHNKGNIFTKRK